MILQLLFLLATVFFAIYTLNRGIRLLRGKDVMLSVKKEKMIFSSLSPRDKRLFGWVHVVAGGGFLLAFLLILVDAIPAAVYNLMWLLWAVVVVGGTPLMRRRSHYDNPTSDPLPPMPTLES